MRARHVRHGRRLRRLCRDEKNWSAVFASGDETDALPPETRHYPLVNLARHAHVAEIVITNLFQLAGLI